MRLLLVALVALLLGVTEARAAVEIEEASQAPRPFVELVNRGPGALPVNGLVVTVDGCAVAVTGEPLERGQHHLIGLPGYAGLPGADQMAACAATGPFDVRLAGVAAPAPPAAAPNPQNRAFVDADFDGVRDSIFVKAAPGPAAATGPLLSGLAVRAGRARFTLSRPAVVTLQVERCARVREKACAVASRQPGETTARGSEGANTRLVPRLRSLAPGRYRLAAFAVDAAGVRSAVLRAAFTVARKR